MKFEIRKIGCLMSWTRYENHFREGSVSFAFLMLYSFILGILTVFIRFLLISATLGNRQKESSSGNSALVCIKLGVSLFTTLFPLLPKMSFMVLQDRRNQGKGMDHPTPTIWPMCFMRPYKKGQGALHAYCIANFVASWLKWL